MKKIILVFTLIIVMFFFSGCISKVTRIEPLDTKIYHIDEICIEKNDRVIVDDFLPFLIKEFKKYGIKSKIYSEKIPNSCYYELQYSAHKKWDMKTYFGSASLEIYHKNKLISSVKYESQKGFDLTKYEGLEKKFTPIISKLLKGHTPPSKEEMIARKEEYALEKAPVSQQSTLEYKLAEIKKMNENGTITNGEYASKREQLLKDY